MIGLQGVQGCKRRIDPLRRVLLRIAGMGRADAKRSASADDHALLPINQSGLDRRGAEIDAEIHDASRLTRGRRLYSNRVVQLRFRLVGQYALVTGASRLR